MKPFFPTSLREVLKIHFCTEDNQENEDKDRENNLFTDVTQPKQGAAVSRPPDEAQRASPHAVHHSNGRRFAADPSGGLETAAPWQLSSFSSLSFVQFSEPPLTLL
ncbi:hypothetical protein Ga0100231_010040 [Opitutaceae bacterium TAV4]|nr:hypothetical protein Ga0100231_010040 [Opitutaceae bacterium TAV4]RRJ98699.1 hypothetical protein Ga0100230_010155 [Opitutaceae bacterium TAV3]